MKVILLKDVKGVGRKGEVKDFADGYALNALIPKGIAVQATAERLASHEAAEKLRIAREAGEAAALRTKIQSLENAEIRTNARATEKGGLFKAIGEAEIARMIRDQKQVQVETASIDIAKAIKEVGEHPITIKAAGTAARMRLVVEAL